LSLSCILFQIKGTIEIGNFLNTSILFQVSINIPFGLFNLENILAFIFVVLTHILTGTPTFIRISCCNFKTYFSKSSKKSSGNQVISQKASSIENGSI